ncbi:1-deoxy-D-xylulose-5-phosphate reductoisomerase [candidate division KSB1 bacterium]|nr:1-deoxy-D-xylulose-5-phosphate reductoisomerase [candidate division KSB1 bacterium]
MTGNLTRRITLLGSTGSIGTNTLGVLGEFREKFTVKYLTAHQNWQKLYLQAQDFRPAAICLTGIAPDLAIEKKFNELKIKTYWGETGLSEIASQTDTDIIINALVGAIGLKPTLLAIEAGKNIALSNKEPLVMAGDLVMRAAQEKHIQVIPIDSEHSAIHQCLAGEEVESIEQLILTASGGPFWKRDQNTFKDITIAEALKHPNWNMGRKITIDSATLMNKGLEVIEARWLFNIAPDKIKVLIHPPSIVHSMVEFVDGSIKAQLGVPDMRIPIQYALSYPARWKNNLITRFDLSQHFKLEFYPPDHNKFRTLDLAYSALKTGGTAPAILNAANEAAVQAFLEEKIQFHQIAETIESALNQFSHRTTPGLHDLLQADQWARQFVVDSLI